MSTDRIVSWLLTYSLHSTLFLGLAWLIAGRLARRAPAAAEVVWRFALIAGLVTATLSSFSPWTPAAGAWKVRSAQLPPAVSLSDGPAERSFRVVAGGASEGSVLTASAARGSYRASPSGPGLSSPTSTPRSFTTIEALASVAPSLRWQGVVLAAWAAGVALLLLGAARIVLGLRRRLQDRPRVVGGNLHAQLSALAARADVGSVRLTCSSRVPVPLALGCVRPEICVPPRALAGLTVEQQEGMLAHELAHLVRRDPLWLIVVHLVTCVGFFQPLNWVARRRLRELSELLADAWAVGRTGRPLSLAGCLAEVAGWTFGRRPILPAAAMADRPSHLKVRIQRLLEGKAGSGRVRRAVLGAGLGGSLLIVLGAAPVVRSADSSPAEKTVRMAGRSAELAIEDSASSGRTSGEVRLAAVREEADPVQHPERAVNEVAVEQGVAGGEDAADSDESSDESEEHCDHDAVSDGVEGGVHPHGDADDMDDAIDDAVDAAVDGAMAGVETSLSSLDPIGNSLDSLDDALDVDVEVDLDNEIDQYTSDLDRLRTEGRLSAEEQRKMARRMEDISRQMQQRLQPRIQKMSAEMARKIQASVANNGEMRRMAEEMAKKAAQMRPDPASQRRLQELAARFAADGRMSRQESERLSAEAKRLADSVRLSAPELKELREMARKQGELGRKIAMENRDEIEKAKREMREAIEVEMRGVRQEIDRQRAEMRERSRDDRKHQKERLDKEREERRDRDHN